ncbi:MAG: BON domain-containing protein [Herbaspirillum sp.]
MIELNSGLQRGWQRVRRPLATVAVCGMMAFSLQGCLGLVVGGAVMGTMAATDRRTLGAQTEDKTIAVKSIGALSNLPKANDSHINLASFNRKVLLTGEVPDAATKAAAQREVAGMEGVLSVDNELEIGGVTSLTSRSNDTLITGKVKASFLDDRDVYANSIKVVTERGIVYLMGRVTNNEGTRAGAIAAGVAGVQKVVKVFDYITPEELSEMNAAPAATPAPAGN